LFFASYGLGVGRIGILKAVYPAVWGTLQAATGPLSDRWGRKGLIVAGMWVQAAGIVLTVATRSFGWWLFGSVLLGLGTAMVYPVPNRSRLGRFTPFVAGPLVERLPLLAGSRLRGGRALGRDHRRHFGDILGHRVCGSIDVYLRSSRGTRHAGAEEG